MNKVDRAFSMGQVTVVLQKIVRYFDILSSIWKHGWKTVPVKQIDSSVVLCKWKGVKNECNSSKDVGCKV